MVQGRQGIATEDVPALDQRHTAVDYTSCAAEVGPTVVAGVAAAAVVGGGDGAVEGRHWG